MNRTNITEFEDLVENHSREIYIYLWRMLGDPQDAEDAQQESFMRAFRGLPRLQDRTNMRAWLYKIATNQAYTQLKTRLRRESRTTDLDDSILPALEPAADPDDKLLAVLSAIESLSHKQRSALLLRHYQGFDYPEIAEILQSSQDSARANVYQAIRKLRNLFAEEG